MGIRNLINQNKVLGVIVVVLLLGTALFVAWSSISDSNPTATKKSFYTIDDGKTYFTDAIDKPYPFEHNGRQAVRAYVFKSEDGKEFVAYLERLTEKSKAAVIQLKSSGVPDFKIAEAYDIEVKKPGQEKWVSPRSREAISIMDPVPPGGRSKVVMVVP